MPKYNNTKPLKSIGNDVAEKVDYWSKIFMYCEKDWNNIGPIVEIIKNLKKNCIISYKYGKGQHPIRTYGTQYYHRVIGNDFKNKEDYIKNIVNGCVKFIFVFSDDNDDNIVKNLMGIAKKYKIILISYSVNTDYIFYNYSADSSVLQFKSATDVINGMEQYNDYLAFKNIITIFPEFDFFPENNSIEFPILDRCLEILKNSNNNECIKRDKKKIQLYSSDTIENEQVLPPSVRPVLPPVLPPVVPVLVKDKPKILLSKFFKKTC
jgi:hypothetical protein